MSKLVCCSILLLGCIGFVGCGGAVDEVPALTDPGAGSTPEQQKDWMAESMKKGGAPKDYKDDKKDDTK